MILSVSKIREIQAGLKGNTAWRGVDFQLNDLCETAMYLLEGQERLQSTNAKLESTIRESTKTINRLALENSNLKAKREVLRRKEIRKLLRGKRIIGSEPANWDTETS